MKAKYKSKKSGTSLVLALIVIFFSLIMTVALLLASQTSSRMSARRVSKELAQRIAEAGLHQAVMCLKTNSAYVGETNTQFPKVTLQIAVSTPVGQPLQRLITSTATASYAEGLSSKKIINAFVDLGTPPAIGNYSVVTKGPLTLKGNSVFGSLPKTGTGNVASNTSLNLQGQLSVFGSASSSGGITVAGTSNVTGSVVPNTAPVPFPQVSLSSLQGIAAANKVTTGDVAVSGPGTTTLTGLINGNLNLSGSGHVIIKSPVFVTGTISFGGSGPVDGGVLAAAGDITATGQNILSGNSTLVLATMANVSLNNGSLVNGAIYAPNGTVTMNGLSGVYGTVAANAMTISGTSSVIRNTSFNWPSELTPVHMGYYQE